MSVEAEYGDEVEGVMEAAAGKRAKSIIPADYHPFTSGEGRATVSG